MIKRKSNKYHAKKAIFDGTRFDSTKEKDYYAKLLLLKRAKDDRRRVVNIERQLRYDITIKNKKCFFYKLDFKVEYADGRIEHVDIKGCKIGCGYQMFKLKKKCIEAEYGIEIIEI
jgi:Pyruvate/2-oxoacid:ferredoxin oxidoreductase delta subunit